MLLSADEIKKGLLHPEPLVRNQALAYFTESWSTDPTVMPLAIEAIQKYGWENAFEPVVTLADLAQMRETFLWFVDELEKEVERADNWERDVLSDLSQIIASADIALLQEFEAKVLELTESEFDAEQEIQERLRMSRQGFDACWRELEQECEEARGGNHEAVDIGHGYRLADAIGRDRQSAQRVLSILSTKIEDGDDPMQWMHSFAVRAAGEMRLQAAIPALVAKFHKDDGTGNEDVATALGQIGGDAAVEAICHDFAKHPRNYRYNVIAALEHIRSPLTAARCLQLFEAEEDKEIRGSLVQGALNNFESDAIEPARQVASGDHAYELKRTLVGVAMLMDVSFPELAEWKQELEDKDRGIFKHAPATHHSPDPAKTAPVLDDYPPVLPLRPIKVAPKVGRNDPCPCGSGKKYKKCCMAKE